jgi:S1-C subfamily serine protease
MKLQFMPVAVLAVALTGTVAAQSRGADKPLPWLGMGIRSFQEKSGQRLLHVDHVVPKGPADVAGVRPGDLITEVGGSILRLGDDLDFLNFLAQHKPGEQEHIRLIRKGQVINLTLRFGKMPDEVRPAWYRTVEAARRKRAAAARAAAQ